MIGQATVIKIALVAGVSASFIAVGGTVDTKHAVAVLFGLVAGFGFRLSVVVHRHDDASLGRELVINSLAFLANFLLAMTLTTTLAGQSPPAYTAIALVAVLIAATGTTALQLASAEFLKRVWGRRHDD